MIQYVEKPRVYNVTVVNSATAADDFGGFQVKILSDAFYTWVAVARTNPDSGQQYKGIFREGDLVDRDTLTVLNPDNFAPYTNYYVTP